MSWNTSRSPEPKTMSPLGVTWRDSVIWTWLHSQKSCAWVWKCFFKANLPAENLQKSHYGQQLMLRAAWSVVALNTDFSHIRFALYCVTWYKLNTSIGECLYFATFYHTCQNISTALSICLAAYSVQINERKRLQHPWKDDDTSCTMRKLLFPFMILN